MADTENNKNSNSPASTSAPALRFPGFTEPWRRIRLGDNCTIQMCKRIFANQTSEIGEVPFFKIGTIGGYPDTFISKELFEEYKTRYNYPSEGEVMITCAGTVGKTMQFDGIDSYFQDSNIVWIHNPNQLTVNDFLAYVLGKINWNKLNSTTITRIYNDDLRNLIYFAPENVAEQRKIVSLLRLIDERIATQRRLIEDLEKLKSSIIERYFTLQSNTKIKLGDIGSFIRGITYSAEDVTDDETAITIIRANNLNYGRDVNGINVVYITKIPSEKQLLRKGDIAICMANGSSSLVGKNSYYPHDDKKSTIGAFCGIYRSPNPLVRWYMQSNAYKRQIYHSLQGGNGAIANLNSEDILNITIPLISAEKAPTIVSALDNIEYSVRINVRLLDLLNKKRTYLLQRMFI